ncbi:hypothetical protein MJ634_018770 [Providencia rettgeri]|uniref:hypothetical protein n=1 Tax=Providencia TaxID=586 RepID=UPI00155F34F5|nr:hypothetical protein [Providencia rettgeri]EHZ7763242.1 hypothetical protein [Providencia rettgeri]EIJ7166384.1 hypothetical protein [Providencia rettgeri]EJD6047035.1 hypothetical protein [Providencia rettgeri]ELR5091725.1 hypothetical protein [Providencia rettgeri]ELR5106319.1 hypothetical protein [Providencia rettgeri]
MSTFVVTRQDEIFPRSNSEQLFQIQDDLLFDCIGIGKACSNDPNRVTGFNCGKRFGYALLTYFLSRALNIQRLPFCEDRIYTDYYNYLYDRNEKEILSTLDSDKVQKICDEVLRLYQHTQLHLAKISAQSIFIRRELSNKNGYVDKILKLKSCAELLGLTEIKIEMDTLNSFGDQNCYWADIALELEVPAKDIFYCSQLIADRPFHSKTVESGEWVVINRSPTGVVHIPVSSIRIRSGKHIDMKPLSKSEAESFISNYYPIELRTLFDRS